MLTTRQNPARSGQYDPVFLSAPLPPSFNLPSVSLASPRACRAPRHTGPVIEPQRRQRCGVARSAVSRTIQALENVGLVKCLTPDEKMDRYYRITETGKKVAEIIEGDKK